MQFLRKPSPRIISFLARMEAGLKTWGALGVAVFAILYYALYYRSGLNFSGEGGTVALIALRLLDGQRPIVDTFLGYNLMWFYPVAWLFQLTGPDYTALRVFFFGLCTATGVLAFFVLRRVTDSGWFSVLAALGPVLIPGMLFRNYMAFLVMLNMLSLLQAYVFEQRTKRRQVLWMGGAGAALGLTYLMRIDLGAFFTVITAGLIALYPFGLRGGPARRLLLAGAGAFLAVVMFCATHAPFYLDAVKRGYAGPFVAQYTGWIGMVRYLAFQQFAKPPALPEPSSVPTAETRQIVAQPTPAATPRQRNRDVDSESYLQKRSLADVVQARTLSDRTFALATYLPIPAALLIIIPAGVLLVWALVRSDFALRTEALAMLVTTGSALTLFPQYFFFRPDTPHLSEFMAPFLVAMACASWLACRWRSKHRFGKIYWGLMVTICLLNVALYFIHAFPKESSGSVAARTKRKYELVAENGVRVWLKQKEREEIAEICRVIKTYTKPTDYVVCYPYAPTINFMTRRPSYEYNLYVDNAHNVSEFFAETLAEVTKYRPGAILIDNRALNQTEDSRFHNWAAETYEWIKTHYSYAGTFRRQEIYLRPDLYKVEK
ncbi:MAG TPA: hypothetical protein VIS96_03280 [Terrimicrobiaceae bacterium]